MAWVPAVVLLHLTSAFAAPQYGGSGGVVPAPVIAPVVVQTPAPIVQCPTTYQTVWETQYVESEEQECKTVSETLYRQQCQTVYKQQCNTVNEQVCSEQYKQETQTYTDTVCSTQYNRECESRWEEDSYGGKKWVEIPSTCQNSPQQKCNDVQKQRLVQVPYTDCQTVPKQECKNVPKQECTSQPYQSPKQVCETVHRKKPTRVSRRVPQQNCSGQQQAGGGYGSTSGSGSGFGSGVQSVVRDSEGGNVRTGQAAASDKQRKPTSSDAINFGR